MSKGGWQIVHGADVCCWFLGVSTDSSVTEPCFVVFLWVTTMAEKPVGHREAYWAPSSSAVTSNLLLLASGVVGAFVANQIAPVLGRTMGSAGCWYYNNVIPLIVYLLLALIYHTLC